MNLTNETIKGYFIDNTIIYLCTTSHKFYLGNLIDLDTEYTFKQSKYSGKQFWVNEIILYRNDIGTEYFVLPEDKDRI